MSRTITLKSCAVRGPKGEKGEDVLEFAQSGGYTGTEQELAAALALIQQAIPMIVTATVLESEQIDTGVYSLNSVELSKDADDVIGAIAAGRYVAIDLEFGGQINRLHVMSYTETGALFAYSFTADTEMRDMTVCNLYVHVEGAATGRYSYQ